MNEYPILLHSAIQYVKFCTVYSSGVQYSTTVYSTPRFCTGQFYRARDSSHTSMYSTVLYSIQYHWVRAFAGVGMHMKYLGQFVTKQKPRINIYRAACGEGSIWVLVSYAGSLTLVTSTITLRGFAPTEIWWTAKFASFCPYCVLQFCLLGRGRG